MTATTKPATVTREGSAGWLQAASLQDASCPAPTDKELLDMSNCVAVPRPIVEPTPVKNNARPGSPVWLASDVVKFSSSVELGATPVHDGTSWPQTNV